LETALVTLPEPWRELHRSRFAELPLDCGNSLSPGVIYSPELRDWSDKATTTDQARMERYIDRYDLRGVRILHVGIGNSGLAKRFYTRVGEIVGTTIDEPEMEVAKALPLPNYSFVMHNKYSGRNEVVNGKFDIILDNNPTSPCCCIRHLAVLFELYAEKLADGGQIVTDRQGLEWVPHANHPRWGFDLDDLRAVGAVAGFSVFPMTNSVYVLAYSAPPAPGLRSRAANRLRHAAMLPGKIVRNGPRVLARRLRNWARRSGAKR
jgi:hypothetical protein